MGENKKQTVIERLCEKVRQEDELCKAILKGEKDGTIREMGHLK